MPCHAMYISRCVSLAIAFAALKRVGGSSLNQRRANVGARGSRDADQTRHRHAFDARQRRRDTRHDRERRGRSPGPLAAM